MAKDLPQPTFRNPRGIPQAPFISSVDEFANNVDEATTLLGQLQELYQKYQIMEMATRSRLKNLESKVPDLEKSVETVKFISTREDSFETHYELNDTVFAKAVIPPTNTVWLWLGANVMLEYEVNEGLELLTSKLEAAKSGIQICNEDLEFLRENITTVEVNTARVINWRVSKAPKPTK